MKESTHISNPDVPVEATFKWLVKEKEHHKARAEKVAEYARCLEVRIAEMQSDIDKKNELIADLQQRLEGSPTEKQRNKVRKKYKKVVGQAKALLNLMEQFEEALL